MERGWMLSLPGAIKMYLADGPVDMRKGIDGLVAIVRNQWQLDIFSGHLFIFLSRVLDRIKILYYERGGFALWHKRLEKGRFMMPKKMADGRVVYLQSHELLLMLEGIDLSQVRLKQRFVAPVNLETT